MRSSPSESDKKVTRKPPGNKASPQGKLRILSKRLRKNPFPQAMRLPGYPAANVKLPTKGRLLVLRNNFPLLFARECIQDLWPSATRLEMIVRFRPNPPPTKKRGLRSWICSTRSRFAM